MAVRGVHGRSSPGDQEPWLGLTKQGSFSPGEPRTEPLPSSLPPHPLPETPALGDTVLLVMDVDSENTTTLSTFVDPHLLNKTLDHDRLR